MALTGHRSSGAAHSVLTGYHTVQLIGSKDPITHAEIKLVSKPQLVLFSSNGEWVLAATSYMQLACKTFQLSLQSFPRVHQTALQ